MLIPCIDLQDGRAVQLERGRKLKLAEKDVFGLLERFRASGYRSVHVIDLDAALRHGSNGRLVRELCRRAARTGMRMRVGGGVRTTEHAARILDCGAEKVIIGSAAFRNGAVNRRFLEQLRASVGRRRMMIALDTHRGRIVVRGWREKLPLRPAEVMRDLEPFCSAYLCTYVDAEGTLRGTNLDWFRALRRATRLPITAAGGIRSRREVRTLARLGMDAAVGMALYTGKLR